MRNACISKEKVLLRHSPLEKTHPMSSINKMLRLTQRKSICNVYK